MVPPNIPEPPDDPPDWGIFAQADQCLTVTSKRHQGTKDTGCIVPLAIGIGVVRRLPEIGSPRQNGLFEGVEG